MGVNATNILRNFFFCTLQKKETRTGLEWLEGEEIWTVPLTYLGVLWPISPPSPVASLPARSGWWGERLQSQAERDRGRHSLPRARWPPECWGKWAANGTSDSAWATGTEASLTGRGPPLDSSSVRSSSAYGLENKNKRYYQCMHNHYSIRSSHFITGLWTAKLAGSYFCTWTSLLYKGE